MKVLGVMGGTFDPIHYGHLVTAEAARRSFGMEQVVFVPAGHPPHKEGKPISAGQHRYLMTVLATVTNPHFEVSRTEVDRPGPSYAVETIREFHRRYGEDTQIYFITGADAILEICTWYDSRKLLGLCQFIAATRPGYSLENLDVLQHKLSPELVRSIHLLEVPALAISSSDIRERVRRRGPIKYLLPEAVEHYIAKSRLYLDTPADGEA